MHRTPNQFIPLPLILHPIQLLQRCQVMDSSVPSLLYNEVECRQHRRVIRLTISTTKFIWKRTTQIRMGTTEVQAFILPKRMAQKLQMVKNQNWQTELRRQLVSNTRHITLPHHWPIIIRRHHTVQQQQQQPLEDSTTTTTTANNNNTNQQVVGHCRRRTIIRLFNRWAPL